MSFPPVNKDEPIRAERQLFYEPITILNHDITTIKPPSSISTIKALVLTPSAAAAAVLDIPRPVPGPGEVLIRVHVVAANAVDQAYFADPIATQDQRVLGVDFASKVVGRCQDLESSSDRRVIDGARVAGFAQGDSFQVTSGASLMCLL
ncbi:hypothetical protein BDV12DRAFT_200492 [Aspergillus spectabilis]